MLTIHMLAQECGEVCQPITNAVRVGTELHLVGNTTPDAAGRHAKQHHVGREMSLLHCLLMPLPGHVQLTCATADPYDCECGTAHTACNVLHSQNSPEDQIHNMRLS